MPHSILDFVQLDSSTIVDEASKLFTDSQDSSDKRVLKLVTDATHSGTIINNRVYPGSKVKDGAKTFFKGSGSSFDKPFLKNHDRNIDPIGRVVDASYYPTVTGDRWDNDALNPIDGGSGFLRTTSHIMDQDAIDKFLDGRFQTVSQSAVTDAAYCSKCSKDKENLVPLFSSWKDAKGTDMECNHYPGDMSDGTPNYVITGSLAYKELSQVNVPADSDGIHVSMELMKDEIKDSESLFSLYGKNKELTVLNSSVHLSIVDSQGNPIKSLDTRDFITTKVISIPTQPFTACNDNERKEEEKNTPTISDSDFAEARILRHFSAYKGLKLSTEDSAKCDLAFADLTEYRSALVKKGFYLNDSLPFVLGNKETIDASIKLKNILFTDTEERSKFLRKMEDQAKKENITYNFKGKHMDEDQAKSLLESLDAEKAKSLKACEDREAIQTKFDELNKKVADSEVAELLCLRSKVGHADCTDMDKLSKDDKEALTKKYADMSDELRYHLLTETRDQVEKGFSMTHSIDEEETDNPMEDGAGILENTNLKDNSDTVSNSITSIL